MTSLRLVGVTVERQQGAVISDVSLEVNGGAVTAVVGPNGAGKTSLLEAISGVIPAAEGLIELDGVDVRHLSRLRRSRLGIAHVQQGRAIFPSLTTRENITVAAPDGDAADAALAPFPELSKRLGVKASLLSGGEQQMLVLARALAARPRVLLIDEMSLGLAPIVFLRLLPIVREIAATGVGVLLVEQFAQHALAVATNALVVSGGGVRYSGPASTLLEDSDQLAQVYLG